MNKATIAQDHRRLNYLPPQTDKGKTVMKAPEQRQSTLGYSDKERSPQDTLNMLWVANRIHRANNTPQPLL